MIFPLTLLAGCVALGQARLWVQGNHFMMDGKQVFLSGGNLPYVGYGTDFGEDWWNQRKDTFERQFTMVHNNGGNSVRLWIHVQGEATPIFDSRGYVTKTDEKGNLLGDLKKMLDKARSHDILVIPTLWNCAVNQDYHHRLDGLIRDPAKLQSYIDKVLIPMVRSVIGHPALGAWDIVNEPEAMIIPNQYNSNKCYDTTALDNSGAGWAGHKYTYQQMLKFINLQAAAIKETDQYSLVTIGAWNAKSNTGQWGFTNHYSNACLRNAGNKQLGTLDFYQFHSYARATGHTFDSVSPFNHRAGNYKLNKPIVVGEFWTKEAEGKTINQLFDYVYNHGYAGAWTWQMMQYGQNQRQGMAHIRDYTAHGTVAIDVL